MKEYDAVLQKASLFEGIPLPDIHKLLLCRGNRIQSYQSGDIVIQEGSRLTEIGVILRGRVCSYKNEYAKVMLFDLPAGQCFGSTFIFNGISEIPVTFIAEEDSKVLFLDLVKLVRCCSKNCSSHGRLIENLMHLTSEKNKLVQLKKELLKLHDCKSKVLLYLMFMREKNQNTTFEISENREKLAAFLNIRKNELINTLISLKKDGIITYSRAKFTILDESAFPLKLLDKFKL